MVKKSKFIILLFIFLAGCSSLTANNSDDLILQATQTANELANLEARVEMVEGQVADGNQEIATLIANLGSEEDVQYNIDQLQLQLDQLKQTFDTVANDESADPNQQIVSALTQIIDIQAKIDAVETSLNGSIARLESLENMSPSEVNSDELLSLISRLENRLETIESNLDDSVASAPGESTVTVSSEPTATQTSSTDMTPTAIPAPIFPDDCTTAFTGRF